MNGFKGNSAKKYFEVVGMSGVGSINEKDNMKRPTNQYEGLVVSDETYHYTANMMTASCDNFISNSSNIIDTITDICSSDFLVPSAVPKLKGLVENVKTSLSHFEEMNQNTKMIMNQFTENIADVDNSANLSCMSVLNKVSALKKFNTATAYIKTESTS